MVLGLTKRNTSPALQLSTDGKLLCDVDLFRLTEEEKLYPAAALPNQFVANYTEYTPEQMSMLPVDTITKW